MDELRYNQKMFNLYGYPLGQLISYIYIIVRISINLSTIFMWNIYDLPEVFFL
jgi:hypothetical protein